MTIQLDPTTCKPDDVFRIRVGDRVFVGERVDPEDYLQWRLNRPASVWARDEDVTVLHRLVPEADDVVDSEVTVLHRLDVPMQPWDILREAESIARHLDGIERSSILAHANHLEREHRAAQEKAEQDVAREALIVKAARIQCDAIHGPGAFDDREPDDHVRDRYVDSTRALADAGLLAETVQS